MPARCNRTNKMKSIVDDKNPTEVRKLISQRGTAQACNPFRVKDLTPTQVPYGEHVVEDLQDLAAVKVVLGDVISTNKATKLATCIKTKAAASTASIKDDPPQGSSNANRFF